MPIVAAVLHQRAEDLLRVLDRAVQFVADLAGHALAQRLEAHAADLRVAEPHEADVAQAFAGRLLHDEQRVRSLHLQDELARAELRRLGVVAALAELVVGPGDAGPAGEEVLLLGELHQHAFAHDLAGAVAEDDVLGLSDVELGEAVDRDRGEELQRVATFDPHLCERRPVADVERVLPGHALVDPVGVLPRLEARAELRVGVHVARDRQGGACGRLPCVFGAVMTAADACVARVRRATTPPITMRAYSSIIASMVEERGTPRLVMTELQSPSSASVASFGSRSARNCARLDALGEQSLDQILIGVRQCRDRPDVDRSAVRGGAAGTRRCSRRRGARRSGARWFAMAARSLSAAAIGSAMMRLQVRDEVLDAELADRGERGLLGREVVVEARLPHAEPLGDVARAGAGIAFLDENGRGRVEHLAIAALPTRRRLPAAGGGGR